MISEHWLHNNKMNTLSELSPDFDWHGNSSRYSSEVVYGLKRGQGGVAILWNKKLKGIAAMETISHDRICAVRLEDQNGSVFMFISVYMPANGSKESLAVILDELAGIISNLDRDTIPIIAGDFNGDIGSEGGPRSKRHPTKAGSLVLKFIHDHNLCAANLSRYATGSVETFEGHNGSTTIDYVLIPACLMHTLASCHTSRDHPLNTSDHFPIETILRIDILPRSVELEQPPLQVKWNKLKSITVHDEYQGEVSRKLNEIMHNLKQVEHASPELIDETFTKVVNALHEAAEVIPKTKFKKHLKPYWCSELSDLKRDKMYWFGKWKGEGRTRDSENFVYQQMKKAKKLFHKRIRQLSNGYHNQMVQEAATKAEVNRTDFWKYVKRMNQKNKPSYSAITNSNGKVVYELDQVLEVWRLHFDKLSTPKSESNFNIANFNRVSSSVKEYNKSRNTNVFLEEEFQNKEVQTAIKKLNLGKTPGYDGISSEHVKYAGIVLVTVLCILFNMCVACEYIPCNFRRGIQVPLYKGKNTCSLNPDNYRGITLLSTFNKLFEAIVWERIQQWWFDERVTSVLQGAARKGFSCVHTALTLQETIAKERENGRKVFVAFYDVAKAFDSVWTDGLFFQLHEMGVTGSLWRLLYRSYIDFQCCVRIGSKHSNWYTMECGIHQGGYLSLVKYTAYIDSLITILEESDLCCKIYRIKSSPLGYADDLAASTVSKQRMDRVMSIVYQHGCDWRYSFNASKSAVLVYGDTDKERRIGMKDRMFSLGGKRVQEKMYYDHVGVKACVKGDTHVRTEEKISKARKVLNMSTNVGIRKGGLNLSTCNLIFWTLVIPTLMFGCEIWLIKQKDIDLLNAFQRYAARRLQRFHFSSFNITSYVLLGWMNIVLFIKARKVIFIRTILMMEEKMPIRKILMERINEFVPDSENQWDSPIKQILQYCHELGVLPSLRTMASCTHITMSKYMWKKLVWDKAWEVEKVQWSEVMQYNSRLDLIKLTVTSPAYSIWWSLADANQNYMRRSEVMVKLLCHSSRLKGDDGKLVRSSFSEKSCTHCELAAYEEIRHIIMQCPYQTDLRVEMYKDLHRIEEGIETKCTFDILIGNNILGRSFEEMVPIWQISCTYISRMYYRVINARKV